MRRLQGDAGLRFLLVLTAVSLALAIVGGLNEQRMPTIRAPAAADDDIPEPPVLDFTLPPLTYYEEVVERPLFAADRRPPPPEEEAPVTEPVATGPLQVRLLGTIITSDRRQALFQDGRDGKLLLVGQGEPLQDWQVGEIRADRVVLTGAGQTEEVLLRVYDKASGVEQAGAAGPVAGAPQRPTVQSRGAKRRFTQRREGIPQPQ